MLQQDKNCQLSKNEKVFLLTAEYKSITTYREYLERELAETIRRQRETAQKLRKA